MQPPALIHILHLPFHKLQPHLQLMYQIHANCSLGKCLEGFFRTFCAERHNICRDKIFKLVSVCFVIGSVLCVVCFVFHFFFNDYFLFVCLYAFLSCSRRCCFVCSALLFYVFCLLVVQVLKPCSMTETELRPMFVPFGEIVEITIIRDRFTQQSRGFIHVMKCAVLCNCMVRLWFCYVCRSFVCSSCYRCSSQQTHVTSCECCDLYLLVLLIYAHSLFTLFE